MCAERRGTSSPRSVLPRVDRGDFDRDTGRYRAKVDDKTDDGKIDMPEDLHNGITISILKNLMPDTAAVPF